MNSLLAIAGGLMLVLHLNLPNARPSSFPAATFAEAVERVEMRQAEDDSIVVPGARSILLTHGGKTPRVFVLLHGFTDSPKQFAALGERLFATGDNVYIPRLPHHAERTGRLRSIGYIRWAELAAFGDSSVDIASGLGDSIIVVGLSLGGNIAGSIAQHRSDVFRAVLIAPAIAAGRVATGVARNVVLAGLRLPDLSREAPADTARPDYVQGISTRGLAEVLRLGAEVKANAERAPAQARQIAFLLNQSDRTVSDGASIEVARRWDAGASLVSVYEFPASLKLPHNTMELTEYGGNIEVVLPVVEALARGTRVPDAASYIFFLSNRARSVAR